MTFPYNFHLKGTLLKKLIWLCVVLDFPCPGDGFFAESSDCTIFHACGYDQATTLQCADGLAYRMDIRTCDKQQKVDRCHKTGTHKEELPQRDPNEQPVDDVSASVIVNQNSYHSEGQ